MDNLSPLLCTLVFFLQLINHKEIVRQISELDDEDFSLLECAVSRPDQALVNPCHKRSIAISHCDSYDGSGLLRVPLHIGLREEDMEDMSVAEQLECLLERLRMDGKGRVSTDSGAISDMESLSGTTVDEEESKPHREHAGEKESESKCLYSHPLNGESSETTLLSEGTRNSNAVSGLEACQLEKVGCVNKETERAVDSHSQQRHRVPSHVKKRGVGGGGGGREREFRGVGNTSMHQRPSTKHLPLKESLKQARGVAEKTNRIPRVELIEHPHHKDDTSESRQKNRQSFHHHHNQQEKEESVLCVVSQESKREEDNDSPTEGGPFITHWGKGRWKRNNSGGASGSSSRDYNNKRHYNSSQQFTSQSRQQFVGSRGGGGGGEYRQKARDFSNRYSTRFDTHNRDSSHNGYKNTSSFVRHRGREVVGTNHAGGSKSSNTSERHKFPSGQSSREEQLSAGTVSNEAVSHVATPPISSSTTLVTESPPAVVAEKQPIKLSYARVTGSTNTSSANKSVKTVPPTPVVVQHDQSTPSTITKSQSNNVDQSVPLPASHRNKCTSVSPGRQDHKTIPTTQPEIMDHDRLAHTPTSSPDNTIDNNIDKTTPIPVDNTTPEMVDTLAVTSSTKYHDDGSDVGDSGDGDDGTKCYDYEIIAASFNYSEIVEFLRQGEIERTHTHIHTQGLSSTLC